MDWEKTARKQIRRSVDMIAIVILAELLLNLLIYPLVQQVPEFAETSLAYQFEDMVLYIIVFAVPFAVGARLTNMSVMDLMGRGKPSAEIYLMTIGLVMGWSFTAGFFAVGLEELLNHFGMTEPVSDYILPATTAAFVMQFIATAIVPPIVEELCFRGFFLNLSVRSMGTWAGICLTSICFWLAHYSIEIFPLAVGFGIIGGYIRRRYGSLLPSMCAHMVVNSVYIIINAAVAYGGEALGNAVGVIVYLAEIMLGAVGVVLFLRNGCFSEIVNGAFGVKSDLSPQQITFAVVTSIPVLVVLILSIYFITGGLEVL